MATITDMGTCECGRPVEVCAPDGTWICSVCATEKNLAPGGVMVRPARPGEIMGTPVKFKHKVGKSTFEYGFTIPKTVYDAVKPPAKGEKRTVKLHFLGSVTDVELKTLNNAVGHCQVRYEAKKHLKFRELLKTVFIRTLESEGKREDYLEIWVYNSDELVLAPVFQK
jgi:hypothetical protein